MKAVDVCIRSYPFRIIAFWKGDPVLLQRIPDEDLLRRRAVLLAN